MPFSGWGSEMDRAHAKTAPAKCRAGVDNGSTQSAEGPLSESGPPVPLSETVIPPKF